MSEQKETIDHVLVALERIAEALEEQNRYTQKWIKEQAAMHTRDSEFSQQVLQRDNAWIEEQRQIVHNNQMLQQAVNERAFQAYVGSLSRGIRYGWISLEDLRPGAIFITKQGVRAVKSEYYYNSKPDAQCQCVLLESGEYAHFEEGNQTLVHEVSVL